MAKVVVIGSLNVDSVVAVARHPRPGETVIGGDLRTLWGGKGANQAVAAARAGAHTRMIGRVGADPSGERYIRRLESFGIDASGVHVDSGSVTGHAAIAVDARGENTIIVSSGANARVDLTDLAGLEFSAGDVLLLQLEVSFDVVCEAAERAVAAGARVVLNVAPFAPVAPELLALADPVVVNEHEAALLAEQGLEPNSLLVTLGAEGARWGQEYVRADRVQNVVDTTGAGDCYCGTLAAGLAAGADRATAMRAASVAAALSVQWEGAQPD